MADERVKMQEHAIARPARTLAIDDLPERWNLSLISVEAEKVAGENGQPDSPTGRWILTVDGQMVVDSIDEANRIIRSVCNGYEVTGK